MADVLESLRARRELRDESISRQVDGAFDTDHRGEKPRWLVVAALNCLPNKAAQVLSM